MIKGEIRYKLDDIYFNVTLFKGLKINSWEKFCKYKKQYLNKEGKND